MHEKIGEGGFGTVHLATNRESSIQYAIKFMDMTQTRKYSTLSAPWRLIHALRETLLLCIGHSFYHQHHVSIDGFVMYIVQNAEDVNSIYKESNSIKKLRHKNIVEMYHAFVEGKQLIMIMELAKGGELMEYVRDKGNLNEKEARKILIQIVNALQYCHSHGVVHRDLKLENIMFKDVEELFVKVIDFGISGVCTTFQADRVDAGTIAYMPPECFDGNAQTSPALDIWAIGLMFYAMLYGTLPFWGENESQTKAKIREARLRFPAEIPVTQMGKDICKLMLNKDPE